MQGLNADAYIAIELSNLVPQLGGQLFVAVNYAILGFHKTELLSQARDRPLALRFLE
jgi:hypothetical protein